jgi:hypothetical protein
MTLKDKQLECMHHLGSSLRRVRLGGNICLSPSAIATFLQKAGKNLQELDLSGCQVNDEVYLIFLAHTIARLRSIHNSLAHALRSTMPREVPAAPRLNKTLRASQVRLLFNCRKSDACHDSGIHRPPLDRSCRRSQRTAGIYRSCLWGMPTRRSRRRPLRQPALVILVGRCCYETLKRSTLCA